MTTTIPRHPVLSGALTAVSVGVRPTRSSAEPSRRRLPGRVVQLAPILVAWIFLLAGCASVEQGHDPVVVNAERTQKVAFEAVDTFLALEHSNRDYYRTNMPAVHAVAESIRRRAPAAFLAVKDAVKLYKSNRTPEGKATLQGALAAIVHLGLEASRALQMLNTQNP